MKLHLASLAHQTIGIPVVPGYLPPRNSDRAPSAGRRVVVFVVVVKLVGRVELGVLNHGVDEKLDAVLNHGVILGRGLRPTDESVLTVRLLNFVDSHSTVFQIALEENILVSKSAI